MKTRFVFSAFCMLVAMTMATGAFAQGTFQVSAGATQGRMNGHTEKAGGITLALTSGMIDSSETGTVLIDYGVPITNALGTTGDGNNIVVEICSEGMTTTNAKIDGSTITVTVEDSITCALNSLINIEGVRLSLVGSGRDNITASVSGTGDVRVLGGVVTVTVMNSIVDELTDDGVEVATTLTLIRHTGDPDGDDTKFKLLIKENTVRSFDGAQINLEFSGIPDGVEVMIDAWVATAENVQAMMVDQDDPTTEKVKNDQLAINSAGNLIAVITAEENKASVLTGALAREDILPPGDEQDDFDEMLHVGGMLTSGVDVIIVLGTIDGADDDDLLPLNLDIQVTADVGPIGVAKPIGVSNPPIPRFATDKTTAVTVIDSSSAQSTMDVAYVLSGGEYDTGIAVSNMTKEEAGAVHFAFFMNGQELKYSTPAMLAPQSTMTFLLSDLLTAAEHTGSFSGYMTITADFTKANGVAYISDFTAFTSATTVTVMDMK